MAIWFLIKDHLSNLADPYANAPRPRVIKEPNYQPTETKKR
jgi:hypothetical protein